MKSKIKKDFSEIYAQDSPVPYLKEMRRLEYRIANITKSFYQYLANTLYKDLSRPIEILDIGSSYGINSSLLIYDITMSELDNFFLNGNNTPTNEQTVNFFKNLPKVNPQFKFSLIDTSSQALRFANDMELCTQTFCINLEQDEVSSNASRQLGVVDMIIATGCVGYIGHKSFMKLFEAINHRTKSEQDQNESKSSSGIIPKPLFAFSVLRIYPVDEIQKVFEKNGFVLIKSEIPSFRQRHFADNQEQTDIISLLKERGVDTTNLEDDGYYYSNFYLGGPREHKDALITWLRGLENFVLNKTSSPKKGV